MHKNELQPNPQRAVLVGAEVRTEDTLITAQESLDELARLAETAGVEVAGCELQRLNRISPATFIGTGKLAAIAESLPELDASVVIFDDELSPRHQREIEQVLGENVHVLDRSALILDIFAQHANTREGALQVELAQYEYRLPRLTRQWTHLARQAGGGAARGGSGGVGLRGPGETQLEVDRREISRKISRLKEEIEAVRAHRQRHRHQRSRVGIPTAALVGYTNAGKSTLLNALTGADAFVADQLFATLDTTTRRVSLPSNNRALLLSDTVGFIQKLPVDLIAAFRATLEEVTLADLLVHVVDVSHELAWQYVEAVEETLQTLNATEVPRILVLNKIDKGQQFTPQDFEHLDYRAIVNVSALNKEGFENLLAAMDDVLMAGLVPISALVPYSEGDILSAIHEFGVIESLDHNQHGVQVEARVPPSLAGRLEQHMGNTPE